MSVSTTTCVLTDTGRTSLALSLLRDKSIEFKVQQHAAARGEAKRERRDRFAFKFLGMKISVHAILNLQHAGLVNLRRVGDRWARRFDEIFLFRFRTRR